MNQLENTRTVAWSGLKLALDALRRTAEVFPPLQAAIDGIIGCLEIVQASETFALAPQSFKLTIQKAAAIDAQDYESLANDLKSTADQMRRHVHELDSEVHSGSIAYIASRIADLTRHISQRQEAGHIKRATKSTERHEDVIRCYHQIQTLFGQMQSEINIATLSSTNKMFTWSLLQNMSPVNDARYNSPYSMTIKRQDCTPKTREGVQIDLRRWVKNLNTQKVYWMNGMAGTGKTTIAYSLCRWLEENKLLGANFFCSRLSTSCCDVKQIMPTIAYQLAQYSPSFRSSLCRILKADPSACVLDIGRQFEKLIKLPMKEIESSIPNDLVPVVVIDALDECENRNGIRWILQVLMQFAADLPLKFFVASRPETVILENMLSVSEHSRLIFYLHNIEKLIVEGDIKKYLEEALRSMRPPPTFHQIERLAKKAGNLFIYAATVSRYICPDDLDVDSHSRLDEILELDPSSCDDDEVNIMFQELNQLYSVILEAAHNKNRLTPKEIDIRRLVLRTVVCVGEPLTLPALASFLDLPTSQVYAALKAFRSVLHVSEENDPISTLHASFPDYIFSHSRSGVFHCDRQSHHHQLAVRCFDFMNQHLRFNICRLESSFEFDDRVPGLAERVKANITPALFYACRFWGDHLRQAPFTDPLCRQLVSFLTFRLLLWMEVLNLRRSIDIGPQVLLKVQTWLPADQPQADVVKQTVDARNFVTQFAANPCSRSTPHIYISMLPCLSKTNSVFKNFEKHTKGLINIGGAWVNQMKNSQSSLAAWTMDSGVNAVAISFDGTRLVAGLRDGSVFVKNAHTGTTVVGPLRWGGNAVMSVAFSPDATHVAASCTGGTICVWDAHTGTLATDPFKGHGGAILSVAFSPNGAYIASGSRDHTVRVWGAYSGVVVAGPFKGHAGPVLSVTFCSDGTRIASGSLDKAVRVWDVKTSATVVGPLSGHTEAITTVAFSPDSMLIASGSADCTIRVWGRDGAKIGDVFSGHTKMILSIAFSPDSSFIVSGSWDLTIHVWDVRTGAVVSGPFQGHTSSVNAVAFSPDGSRIVSGSQDCTVRVWNAHPEISMTDSFEGHASAIQSVAFSPEGTRIVSGSADCTLRIWDTTTCTSIAGPFEGHMGWVNSVAFAPDGKRLFSASRDRTIRNWDVQTGTAIVHPCQGYSNITSPVVFSLDRAFFASDIGDCNFEIRDAYSGRIFAGPFRGHTGPVISVAFSPNDTQIVSGSGDCTIRIWNIANSDPAGEPFRGHTGPVQSVAFSPNGKYIASGSWDGTIRIWDAQSCALIAGPHTGHTGWVTAVSFSPDSTRLASGSEDCSVRVWDISTPDASMRNQTLNVDGWVLDSGLPFLWVSPELRTLLPYYPNTTVITRHTSARIDYHNTVRGREWSKCYEL